MTGATKEYIEAIRNIDWKNVNIEEQLAEVKFDFSLNARRTILYQAIKMSRADGIYHEKEKAAVYKAAEILGIEKSVVASLESVAETEELTEQKLLSILTA